MNPFWCVTTGRLALRPVWGGDLPDLIAIKADPRVFAVMLGGVRTAWQTTEELADDIAFWGRHGVGMWTVREVRSDAFLGLVGIMLRADGRGMALRFAFDPEKRGAGYASEAAGAALRFGHERAGLLRIVAVARASNFSSRTLLGAIGMREREQFQRDGMQMLVYESVAVAASNSRTAATTSPGASCGRK
jgi:RimJ/RimL family protein N-acetyltransferase